MGEIIYTLEKIPEDMKKYYKTFVKILIKEEITQMGMTYSFIEIEGSDKSSKTFKISPSLNTPTEFKVSFVTKEESVDVLYESKVELQIPKMGNTIQTGLNLSENEMVNKSLENITNLVDDVMGEMVENLSGGIAGDHTDFDKQSVDAQLIPLIQNCLNKTKKKLQDKKDKKEKNKKDKKEKDKKDKKEKKPKMYRSFENIQDPMTLLKLKFVEGEITEDEYLRKKKVLED